MSLLPPLSEWVNMARKSNYVACVLSWKSVFVTTCGLFSLCNWLLFVLAPRSPLFAGSQRHLLPPFVPPFGLLRSAISRPFWNLLRSVPSLYSLRFSLISLAHCLVSRSLSPSLSLLCFAFPLPDISFFLFRLSFLRSLSPSLLLSSFAFPLPDISSFLFRLSFLLLYAWVRLFFIYSYSFHTVSASSSSPFKILLMNSEVNIP